jgi:Na+/melibiose symporter-like transporter
VPGAQLNNELIVPVGTPMRLTMTSTDVIHSFFIPVFRLKKDVVPGRYTVNVVRGDDEGRVPAVLLLAAHGRPQAHRHDVPGVVDPVVLPPSAASSPAGAPRAVTPGETIMSPSMYNKAFTLHGAIMVFLFIIPSIPGALGNFFLPIMLGAKDVAFPKLNLLSFYIYVLIATIFASRHR